MNIPYEKKVSLEEFFKIREENDALLEYVDGYILMSPSPSTGHQRVSRDLLVELTLYFDSKECEVFPAPFDVELYREGIEGTPIVIPDILIICDKSGLDEKRYRGVPSLIIEILSPSNQAHDLITKMNLYSKYGVKEYWIVNPVLKSIQIYTLNNEGSYVQTDVLKDTGTIKSVIFDGLNIDMQKVFKNII
ncbi:Uma2 family endonuclease [Sutcliffiella cohnii]